MAVSINVIGVTGGAGASTLAVSLGAMAAAAGRSVEVCSGHPVELADLLGTPVEGLELLHRSAATDLSDIEIRDHGRHDDIVPADLTVAVMRGPSFPAAAAARRLAERVQLDGLILLREEDRVLTPGDLRVQAPMSCLDVDPRLARAIDAGLLATRMPLPYRDLVQAILESALTAHDAAEVR